MAPSSDDSPEPTVMPPGTAVGASTDMEATRLPDARVDAIPAAKSSVMSDPGASVPPAAAPSTDSSIPWSSGGEAAGGRAAPAPIGTGTLLSHTYLVEGLIARGGMGEVHRARHIDMNTWHAVKVIRPELAEDAKMVELLRREAAALREIRHEAVVSYDGVFRDEYGRILLSMEYLDGPSLHEILQAGPLDAGSVAILLDRIASGLGAAHQRGIVHRDMSTDNVILPGRRIADAKIIDFGIAKQTAAGAGTVIGDGFAGKYGYASPEQFGLFGGQVGPQSDIYSAGLVLAAAALGTPLDMGRSPQAMIERRMSVPDLSALDEPLRGVLCSMLEPDPQNRVKTMTELVGALTRRPPEITPFDVTSFPVATPPAEQPASPSAAPFPAGKPAKAATAAGQPKKTPVGLIAGGVGGLVAAGVAGFLLFGQSPSTTSTPASTAIPSPASSSASSSAPSPAAPSLPAPSLTTAPLLPPVTPKPVETAQAEAPKPVQPPVASPTAPPSPAATQAAAVEPAPAPPVSPPPVAPAVQMAAQTAVSSAPIPVPTPSPAPAPAEVVQAAIPAALPAPRPSAADARKAVEAAAGAFSCAGLRTVEAADGLRISGYVGTDDDARTLKAAIGNLPKGIDVDARVAVRPWPLCEALGVAGLPARAEGQGAGALGLGFNRPSMVYRRGEKLEVTVTAGTSGYLTVDYIDMEGNAIHMVPMRLRRDGRLEAGRPVTLGVARSASDRVYTITPPYGAAMILALVTREPLFPADREEVEPAGAYLAGLRGALAKAEATGGVLAQSAFFTTVAE
ncbi:serine/threonine-protein kinase [Azospirillum thiophilum]|uniref:serine/threonine-protein kinase n=1 Tax=Azospirillum thiophilum TaxID=528244 RepID=UPI0009E2A94C|nr:serine/threonine-protein kinase [Azospirillum thiophilum]